MLSLSLRMHWKGDIRVAQLRFEATGMSLFRRMWSEWRGALEDRGSLVRSSQARRTEPELASQACLNLEALRVTDPRSSGFEPSPA